MSERICQYNIDLVADYAKETIKKLSEIMGIEFDLKKYKEAVKEVDDWNDPKGLCIFRDNNNPDRFIFLDAATPGYIYGLTARCEQKESKKIKERLIYEFNMIQQNEEGNEYSFIDDLEDEYNSEKDSFTEALKRCGIQKL
ncbi:MAG: hypothetical protein BWY74_03700 [Firmicutes bacterium ADurb.Bin419]|nr:MAG: hypothetical protein BWY74_03700 [Firmicutes bacterium ADurb.Bin419]